MLGYTCYQINTIWSIRCVLVHYSRSRSAASSLGNNFWPLAAVSGLRPSGFTKRKKEQEEKTKVTGCRCDGPAITPQSESPVWPHLHLAFVSAHDLTASPEPPPFFDVCSLVDPPADAPSPPLSPAKLQKLASCSLPKRHTDSNLSGFILAPQTGTNLSPPPPCATHWLVSAQPDETKRHQGEKLIHQRSEWRAKKKILSKYF